MDNPAHEHNNETRQDNVFNSNTLDLDGDDDKDVGYIAKELHHDLASYHRNLRRAIPDFQQYQLLRLQLISIFKQVSNDVASAQVKQEVISRQQENNLMTYCY